MMSDRDVSPAAKWIGGGLIGLVVLGLLVAFASGPTPTRDGANTAATTTLPTTTPATTSLAVKAPIMQSVAAGGAARLGVHSEAELTHGAKAVLTAQNNGETVRLKVGDKLAIRLVENKTTGYGWALEDRSDPAKQGAFAVPPTLELVHDKSRRSAAKAPSGRPLVGAPGEHVWVLRGVAAGDSELCAAYRRPWLPVSSTEPAQKFCVKVHVTDK